MGEDIFNNRAAKPSKKSNTAANNISPKASKNRKSKTRKIAKHPQIKLHSVSTFGKLNKFFKDNTLMAQPFVKDGNKSVADYLKSVKDDLKVVSFKRVALG